MKKRGPLIQKKHVQTPIIPLNTQWQHLQRHLSQSTLQNPYNFVSERHKILTSVGYLQPETGEGQCPNTTIREGEFEMNTTLKERAEIQGVILICSACHKIIDKKKTLTQIEAYAKEYTGIKFSHGLCAKCFKLEMAKIEEYAFEKPL